MERRKSPLSVERIQIYAYQRHEEVDITFIDQFPYDDRRDFAITNQFAGIAVKLDICNKRYDKGVRRNISVSLIDATSRLEVTSTITKVNINKEKFYNIICISYSNEHTSFVPGHSYRLIITDYTTSETLFETVFHLYDKKAFGNPSKWYLVYDASIRPAWETMSYKMLNTIDDHDYFIRFNVMPKFTAFKTPVLPELELRLHYPNGRRVTSDFHEPMSFNRKDYKDGIKTLEFPFCTNAETNGIFYAELLCMEYPIAGFVFDTEQENKAGVWVGREIKPLKQYSPLIAKKRLAKLLPVTSNPKSETEEKEFEKLIDDFIASQMSGDNMEGSYSTEEV